MNCWVTRALKIRTPKGRVLSVSELQACQQLAHVPPRAVLTGALPAVLPAPERSFSRADPMGLPKSRSQKENIK
jgi:hypothetical protein